MIALISGKVVSLGLTLAVIEVGGFGIQVLLTPNTAAKLVVGSNTTLYTSLVVREDSLTLYGFATQNERDTFELVQTASGVGPRLGLAITSVLTPARLRDAILREDLAALVAVPGVGRKGAQKLVIELKDRITELRIDDSDGERVVGSGLAWRDQVSAGLQGLGWSTHDADTACDKVAHLIDEDPNLSVSQLMRAALQSLARA